MGLRQFPEEIKYTYPQKCRHNFDHKSHFWHKNSSITSCSKQHFLLKCFLGVTILKKKKISICKVYPVKLVQSVVTHYVHIYLLSSKWGVRSKPFMDVNHICHPKSATPSDRLWQCPHCQGAVDVKMISIEYFFCVLLCVHIELRGQF